MTITRFEDIEAWRKARILSKEIYRLTGSGRFAHDFALQDQLRRASVSIMSNIAEGFERDGNKEFRQFLSIAKGSTGEVRSQLYVALDAGYLEEAEFNRVAQMTIEIGRAIENFMRYLASSELRGNKLKELPESYVVNGNTNESREGNV